MADQNARFIATHKLVVGAPPQTPNTAFDNTLYTLGDFVWMKNYNHLTIVMMGGAFTGTAAVTIKQATDFSGTSAKNVTVTERFLNTSTSTASDTWTSTAVTSNTWTWPATNNLNNVIEIDARDLDIANGFEYVAVNVASSGQAGDRMAVLYILSEGRFLTRSGMPTAIA